MGHYDGYQPFMDAVADELGVPVGLLHVGGGVMALFADEIHGSYEMMITDAEDALSSFADRESAEKKGDFYGYMVGVYPSDGAGWCGDAIVTISSRETVTPKDLAHLAGLAVSGVPA